MFKGCVDVSLSGAIIPGMGYISQREGVDRCLTSLVNHPWGWEYPWIDMQLEVCLALIKPIKMVFLHTTAEMNRRYILYFGKT